MKANTSVEMIKYLQPTETINSDSPEIIGFARDISGGGTTDIDKAVKLFYAVRDKIIYDPYQADLSLSALKASSVLARKAGFCIPKAILLAAVLRSEGIPSRLAFANVKNHLMTERLLAIMESNVVVFHGYTEIFLENKWVKATPTFNISLCERFGVLPLDFDGRNDSIFHQFNGQGDKHMEYLYDHGRFADLPYDMMLGIFKENYPSIFNGETEINVGFEEDASA